MPVMEFFPRQLATTDFYDSGPALFADLCRLFFVVFIDAYKEQGIPIDMVMYQNEAL